MGQEIKQLQADGYVIRAAVASKTDEPDYAMFCMKNLVIEFNQDDQGEDDKMTTTLLDCFDKNLIEISWCTCLLFATISKDSLR